MIRNDIFSFGKLYFPLVVGDMLEQNIFGISDLDALVDNITSPRHRPHRDRLRYFVKTYNERKG